VKEAVYARNMLILKRRWPEAARRIEEAPPLPEGAQVLGKGGDPTISVVGEDGRSLLLHSRYDPRSEAKEQLSSQELAPGETVVLLGVGLGYWLEPLLADAKPGLLILAERDPAVFRAALARAPLDALLTRPQVELVLGEDGASLFGALERNLGRVFGGPVRVLVHPPSARAFPSYYQAMARSLREFTKHGAVVLRSALYLSRVSLENRFQNLADYVESPGLRPFLGRFQGYPGVVVSAGPSLDRNVHLLAQLRGKAVVIAVSTALKVLLGRGIRPDFAVVIDYHALSARYFEDIPREDAPPLICDLKASPQAVRVHPGRKLFGADPLVDLLLSGAAGEKGILSGGSTVAHAAFDVARRLGCDPIIFVGQDLSYPEGRLHAAGSAATAQQLPETNRFYTLEMKEWEYYLLHRKTLSRVAGALGGEVWTCDVFLTYLREFEKLFRESPQKVIDATEGGALKAGAEVMPLAEAIARHGGRDIPPAFFEIEAAAPEAATAGAVSERRARSREALERRLEQAEELLGMFRSAARLLEEIVETNRRGVAADGAAARVIALKEEFRRHELLFHVLNQVAQADVFLRQKRDRDLDLNDLRGVARQRAQAERDLEFVRGLRGALEFLSTRLRGAVTALGTPARVLA
jgi:hypothetical protein